MAHVMAAAISSVNGSLALRNNSLYKPSHVAREIPVALLTIKAAMCILTRRTKVKLGRLISLVDMW